MKLSELLVANPEARTEFDAKLAEACAEVKAQFSARVEAAKPFLSLKVEKDGYDAAEVEQIAKCAVDVLIGTEEASGLRSFVRMVDMSVEKRKLVAAQGETAAQRETPGQYTPPEAEILAKVAAQKVDAAAVMAAAKKQSIAPLEALSATVDMNEQLERDKKILASLGG